MNHHKKGRKFGRKRNARNALLKSLAISLNRSERIKTTQAKAKELRPFIEKLITLALKDSLGSRRIIVSRLMNQYPETKKLMNDIAPKYKDRNGGYTRIIKLPRRKSDGAEIALIEFV